MIKRKPRKQLRRKPIKTKPKTRAKLTKTNPNASTNKGVDSYATQKKAIRSKLQQLMKQKKVLGRQLVNLRDRRKRAKESKQKQTLLKRISNLVNRDSNITARAKQLRRQLSKLK